MKNQKVAGNKLIIIALLYVTSVLITISGIFFCIYSAISNLSFKIINTNMPGLVFGLLVAYLGLRYFISVKKLSSEVYKPTSIFSWSNFRKRKTLKSR
ncbi:MAG: hypothetical protein Q8865_06785 [Bacillota bacterium]|nr:hypothetical protein [Bacillota bacterium]